MAQMMARYIHDLEGWPNFTWDRDEVNSLLLAVRRHQGLLLGRALSLGFHLQAEALADTFTQDVLKTSEIEGEQLQAAQVRSSIGRRIGLDYAAIQVDRRVDGVVEVVLDATEHFSEPLTEIRLLRWHTRLLGSERRGLTKVQVGEWRTGPMQVVSGALGHEFVHFEAPTADRVPAEMARFLDWFSGPSTLDGVLKSAVAHLWFVTIHPFDDGNGRIGRAIADMALAQSEHSSKRFYSMSAQIRKERRQYYDMLESAQRGDLDVTGWMRWYLECLERALSAAEAEIDAALRKQQFWQQPAAAGLNERQRIMLNHLLDDFSGKLTTSKWAKMAKTSQDTALRDVTNLVERGLLEREPAGGRSTSYRLTFGSLISPSPSCSD